MPHLLPKSTEAAAQLILAAAAVFTVTLGHLTCTPDTSLVCLLVSTFCAPWTSRQEQPQPVECMCEVLAPVLVHHRCSPLAASFSSLSHVLLIVSCHCNVMHPCPFITVVSIQSNHTNSLLFYIFPRQTCLLSE